MKIISQLPMLRGCLFEVEFLDLVVLKKWLFLSNPQNKISVIAVKVVKAAACGRALSWHNITTFGIDPRSLLCFLSF